MKRPCRGGRDTVRLCRLATWAVVGGQWSVVSGLIRQGTIPRRHRVSLVQSTSGTIILVFLLPAIPSAQKLQREDWGAPPIAVSKRDRKWIIAGKKTSVTVDEANLAVRVQAGPSL